MPTAANAAVLGQLNRENLPERATIQANVRISTASGGSVPDWQPLSLSHVDRPCRVSVVGTPTERLTGTRATSAADYVVAFDAQDMYARAISAGHRLVIRSASPPVNGLAVALTLYVLAIDGPQSFDAFPKVYCTSQPQPGQ